MLVRILEVAKGLVELGLRERSGPDERVAVGKHGVAVEVRTG